MSYKIHLTKGTKIEILDVSFFDIKEAEMYWDTTMSKTPKIIDYQIGRTGNYIACAAIYTEEDSKFTRQLDLYGIPRSHREIIESVTSPYYVIVARNDDDTNFECYLRSSICWTKDYSIAFRFNSIESATEYFLGAKDHLKNISIDNPKEFVIRRIECHKYSPDMNNVQVIYRPTHSGDIRIKYFITGSFITNKSAEEKEYPLMFLDTHSLDNELFFTSGKSNYSFDNIEEAESIFYSRRDEICKSADRMIGKVPINDEMITGLRKFSITLGVINVNTNMTNLAHVLDF